MPNFFIGLLFLLVCASLGLQTFVIYSPQMRDDLSQIWAVELNEETDNSETEPEKTDNEVEKHEANWFHSFHSCQLVLNLALHTQNEFFFNYRSPILSFLNPPPEIFA